MRRAFVTLAALLALSCERHPTQVIVQLDAEPAARLAGASVRARVTSLDGTERLTRTLRLAQPGAEAAFPLHIPLSPIGGDALRGWIFDAWLLGPDGSEIAHQHAQGPYVRGEQRKVLLLFEDSCLTSPCSMSDRACTAGACSHACVEPVPLDAPDVPAPFVPCEPCDGCWQGFSCIEAQSVSSCGLGGRACDVCECDGDVCADGVCTPRVAVESVSAGFDHSCASAGGVELLCWGANGRGQLGTGDTTPSVAPVYVDGLEWHPPETGVQFSCAAQGPGQVYCWGLNDEGQLALGDDTDRHTPSAIGALFGALAAGARHVCAIDASQHAQCWGHDEGQLGQGDDSVFGAPVARPTPLPVMGDLLFSSITAGDAHTCGLGVDGSIWCWGRACCGELGIGPTSSQSRPRRALTPADGTDTGWTGISAGRYHQCALQSGRLYCWGGNLNLQLGRGDDITDIDAPDRVGSFDDWAQVDAGRTLTCAIRSDRSLWCWGGNERGQLGLGMASDIDVGTPRQLALGDWLSVSAGEAHACGVRLGGTLYCWGANDDGRLGVGDMLDRAAPTRVCVP